MFQRRALVTEIMDKPSAHLLSSHLFSCGDLESTQKVDSRLMTKNYCAHTGHRCKSWSAAAHNGA